MMLELLAEGMTPRRGWRDSRAHRDGDNGLVTACTEAFCHFLPTQLISYEFPHVNSTSSKKRFLHLQGRTWSSTEHPCPPRGTLDLCRDEQGFHTCRYRIAPHQPEGRYGSAWHTEVMLGGEQEQKASRGPRESYFGADAVMVQPHLPALPGSLQLLLDKTTTESLQRMKQPQLQRGRHPSIVYGCKRDKSRREEKG